VSVAPGGDRPVVVTGASSGIGLATAQWLAAEGFRVFGTVRRQDDEERLSASGVTPVTMDVTDGRTIAEARRAIAAALGDEPVFGLVNNAGVPSGGAIEHLSLDELRRVLEINTIGVVAVTQAFLPDFRLCRGRIVMMSSISGRVSLPFVGPYAASKYALEALSDSLRREVFRDGIKVSIVEPGPIDTPIWQRLGELDLTAYRDTRYEAGLERLRAERVREGAAALPPARVAEIVSKALRARQPRARYVALSTGDRLKLGLFRRLPVAWADRIVDGQLSTE